MPDLYPAFEMPELVEQARPKPEPDYPESYLFDFEKGDFVVDGAGRVVVADGHTAWKQWCIKTVLTERFACLAYGRDYGVELEEALKNPSRAIVEMEIEKAITEALVIDDRTELVKDFTFKWSGDQLWVNFTVIPVIGEIVRIKGVQVNV